MTDQTPRPPAEEPGVPAPAMPERLMPERLGRYAVRRRVGAGGFATVWLAYDEQLDSPVAIKVLADNWAADHHVRTRFVEEGRFLRRVESPHVVTVYDAGELADGRPYLVMTYADQGTLADRLADRLDDDAGPVPVPQALDVVAQVARGLQALHDRDVLHRDVKPANVLFRTVRDSRDAPPTVRAMLGDLGLGKALDVSSRLTMIAGTPSYVSPEQALGETPDARADQYSLAVLSHVLLTGRVPFDHQSLTAAASPGAPPSLAGYGLPAEVESVVHRGLAREREQRWPSVTAFSDALAEALADWEPTTSGIETRWTPRDPGATQAGPHPSPHPSPRPAPVAPAAPSEPSVGGRPRGRRLLVALAAVVALAAGVGGGVALQRVVGGGGERTVTDAGGTLSVTVPAAWDRVVADEGWSPDDGDSTYPGLSVGTDAERTEGVFVGLLPLTGDFPEVPAHPECDRAGDPVEVRRSVTVTYDGCDGGGVVTERLDQVARNRVLWVQVRSTDRAVANQVLDSVDVAGM